MATPQPSDPPIDRSTRPCAFDLFETALGTFGIAWSRDGIVRLRLPESDAAALAAGLERLGWTRAAAPPPVAAAIALLRRYAAGERIDFAAAALDLHGVPPVHRRIYAVTRRLGFGETATYGAIAAAAGPPVIARTVGVAMAKNPVPILVPCHRVLAAGDRPGGFSAPGGTATKLRLLALEGVRLDGGQPMLPGF
ncbi:methylated-DNA--[protein]-cysteine S-methyltransferase [Rhodoplanes sp. TEM]|uniref:Methylated-DNA--[protein]-cysteine S-methyltransferase n=1 Tax=Rhodoplanes tepidamans TaxID=200616 RepID=A0ABT5JF53_RHOTP|nr:MULTISPECIES: methylated-DNA--[protein]-cysteine S-methyltransferase [Rhodoplanes]MDC7787941.1 methylated-DNA--[protein]-cysteine S-methyltransferase [Rhodoplanes tepidamans]MDC7986915.1 methylated-DNA--[protein]-cysteine S-methyltransferase [Rhodoplanes sp. TEM]MDQ0358370.1 methylated-DNA-[protein]-cysteine S-methyltransferase [Rhodoplanes tepidamans]